MTFQSLLPDSSSLFERALEDVFGRSIEAIEPEQIKTFWDPDRIPVEHMSVLAHALSVDLWDESWSELKKRSVLRRWVGLEFAKGTFSAYRDFIEIAGGTLVEHVLPPGGIYASPDLTKEQWDAWTARQPEVRIKLAHRSGTWTAPLGNFAGETYSDEDAVALDDGMVLRARRAVLRRYAGAPDEDIQVVRLSTETETRAAEITERVIMPAEDPITTIAGDGFAGDGYVGAVDTGERAFSYVLSRDYVHSQSAIWLDTVAPGFQPRDVRYYRVSDRSDAGDILFAGGWAGADFVEPDMADEMLADVLYLHDPDVAAPMVDGISFANSSRVGSPAFQAEFRIQVDTVAGEKDAICGLTFSDEHFATPEDPTRREAVLTAISAAKAKRDKILVTFQNHRRRTLNDGFPLGQGAALGGNIPYTL